MNTTRRSEGSSKPIKKVSGGYSAECTTGVVGKFLKQRSLAFRVTERGCDIIVSQYPNSNVNHDDLERIRWVEEKWREHRHRLPKTTDGQALSKQQEDDCLYQIEGSLVKEFVERNTARARDPTSSSSKLFLPTASAWGSLHRQYIICKENGAWTAEGVAIERHLSRDAVTGVSEEPADREPDSEDELPNDQDGTDQEEPDSPEEEPSEADEDEDPQDM
jgi:hypothetical protein